MPEYIGKVATEHAWLTYLTAVVTVLLENLLPGAQYQKAATWGVCFMIADLVTGIGAARKTGVKITSAGIGRTLLKIFSYGFYVALANAAQFVPGWEPAVPLLLSFVLGLIIATEAYSVLENLEKLEAPLVKEIMDFINKHRRQGDPEAES